ncbi:MAG: helix-turn-helix domain-containing protein [Bacteroidota bacterium]
MSEELIYQKLDNIEKLLVEQSLLKKEVLNFNETAHYLEVSHSHLYKLTSTGAIPSYKPNGKKLYFNRKELDVWLLSNKHVSTDEIGQQADKFQMKSGRVK